MDKQRFEQLWLRCANEGGGGCDGLFEEVFRYYSEPHRRYHTPEHVAHCLTQFDAARGEMDDPDAVELAVWYHDIIYDVTAADNEAESAKLFEERTRGKLPEALIRAVHDLIMVTVHSKARPNTRDEAFMVDIDLSSFGLPWEQMLRDSVAVRDEFPHMSDEEFYPKQKAFLSALLDREHFCFTEFFRQRHEQRARENIALYLEKVAGKGFS